MPTKITIDALSAESFEKAAARVRKLQKVYYNKNREFVRELTKAGLRVISANIQPQEGDSEPPIPNNPHVMVGDKDGVMTATLRLRGKDVMFVEFGAGVHFNGPAGQSPHPLGLELGYTIGSYGLGQGKYDTWVYKTDDGVYHVSEGTEAMMPMWRADQEIRNTFASIAKRVFGVTGV